MKVGITGGIGSGKTTVTRIFTVLGIPVYDADQRAKDIMVADEGVREAVTSLFGAAAYIADEQLDRAHLASRVFREDGLREQLNAIVHPAVHRDFRNWAANWPDVPYVLEEAALIFESGGYTQLDRMILVTAPLEMRIKRVMARNRMDRGSVEARVAAQWTDEIKIPLSDFVIVNDQKASLIRQVMEIHHLLLRENM